MISEGPEFALFSGNTTLFHISTVPLLSDAPSSPEMQGSLPFHLTNKKSEQ